MNVTPAMAQYYEIKNQYADSILFFRMGDFYEMFEDDAKIAHKILGITLTTRNKNAENPILLAGIPFHAKEKYLPQLIKSGYKVAIAEQVSDPKLKGIVQREVVRVVTPGTLGLEGESYDNEELSQTIASLVEENGKYGLSVINLSDHSWKCSEFENLESCVSELYKLSPSEIILQKTLTQREKIHELLSKKYRLNIYYFEFLENPYSFLTKRFGVKNLEGYGIENKKLAQGASAQILSYIMSNQQSNLDFLQNLSYESYTGYMNLDEATIRSLDLIYNIATQSQKHGTLFGVLDCTQTSMGKRQLKTEILHPLQDIKEIQQRQKFISAFTTDTILLDKVRTELNYISDLDAILSRLSLERSSPRDLLSLKKSLQAVRSVYHLIEASNNTVLKKLISYS
ncbi:hypothetical protein N9J72_00325 [Candidatus Gracilibacteria bacterium]|nr:hypothetical protein [Candidatus Gracilibacteria bacterium]